MSPRHFATVSDSDTEIVDEVAVHQETKQGIKTTYRQVRKKQAPQEQTGQASRSRSRQSSQEQIGQALRSRSKKKKQPELRQTEVPPPGPAYTEDMETHLFIDVQDDDLPNVVSEEMQMQATVWSYKLSLISLLMPDLANYRSMAPASEQVP